MFVFAVLTALGASQGKLVSASESARSGDCGPVLALSGFEKMKPSEDRERAGRAFVLCTVKDLLAEVAAIEDALPSIEDALAVTPAPEGRKLLAERVVEASNQKGGRRLVKAALPLSPDEDGLWEVAIGFEPSRFEGYLESARATPRASAGPVLAVGCASEKAAVLADCVGVMESVVREGGETKHLATLLVALGSAERQAGRSAMPQYQRLMTLDPEDVNYQLLQFSEVIRLDPDGTLVRLTAQAPGPMGRCTNIALFAMAAEQAESKAASEVAQVAVKGCLEEPGLPNALVRDLRQLEAH